MPLINSNRRLLLGSAVAVGSAVLIGGLWQKSSIDKKSVSNNRQISPTLVSIIDTLIPSDEFPGGLDIGLDNVLHQKTRFEPKLKQLIARLLPQIERDALARYHRVFHQLNVDQREILLEKIFNQRDQPAKRRDFVQLRRAVLSAFYQSPAGQQSLGYVLPALYPNYHG